MANLGDFRIAKVKEQRNRIREVLKNGAGAELEMPKNDVIFPENIDWLKEFGIKVNSAKDRDGRTLNFLDISEMGRAELKNISIKKGLFEEER